jgi:hypothetical protein
MRTAAIHSLFLSAIAFLIALSFTGCGNSSSTPNKIFPTATGVWLEKTQADDLRQMGRLTEQKCTTLKAAPTAARDSLKIDQYGAIYQYNPVFAATASPAMIEKTKIGLVQEKADKKLEMTLTSYEINNDLSGMVVQLSPDQSRLTIKFIMKNGTNESKTYVRSNEDELVSNATETAQCLAGK